jgi:predicted polyphosphate/ATP-dependent NAD kinase
MKTRKNELDVDFIGGAGPLTKEEEKKISDYIKSRKEKGKLTSQRTPRKLTTRKRVTA